MHEGGTMPWARALAVWVLIALVEIVHGSLRRILLVPRVGEWRSAQIGAVVGALLILGVALLAIRWMGARSTGTLLGIGLLWLVLMLSFEFLAGRHLAGFSWERILSEYDLRRGGLLSLGMLVLALSPLLAARIRGMRPEPPHP
jgi:hypothetical protein